MGNVRCKKCEKEMLADIACCPNCGYLNENYIDETELENLERKYNKQEEKHTVIKNNDSNEKTKKTKILVGCMLVITLLLVYILVVVIPIVKKNNSYKQGQNELNSAEYYQAFSTFNSLDGFKDSYDIKANIVQKLFDEERYEEAFDCIALDESVVNTIVVEETDYHKLSNFIDKKTIAAFSMSKEDVYREIIPCYAVVCNVLPRDFDATRVHVNIGAYVFLAYDNYIDDEEFFVSIASNLRELLNDYSNLDILKRILEQDKLIGHFLSGETIEKNFGNTRYGVICSWFEQSEDYSLGDWRRSFFFQGNSEQSFVKTGNWDDFECSDTKNAGYYCFKNGVFCKSFDGNVEAAIPEFTITIDNDLHITIKSCTSNETIELSRVYVD